MSFESRFWSATFSAEGKGGGGVKPNTDALKAGLDGLNRKSDSEAGASGSGHAESGEAKSPGAENIRGGDPANAQAQADERAREAGEDADSRIDSSEVSVETLAVKVKDALLKIETELAALEDRVPQISGFDERSLASTFERGDRVRVQSVLEMLKLLKAVQMVQEVEKPTETNFKELYEIEKAKDRDFVRAMFRSDQKRYAQIRATFAGEIDIKMADAGTFASIKPVETKREDLSWLTLDLDSRANRMKFTVNAAALVNGLASVNFGHFRENQREKIKNTISELLRNLHACLDSVKNNAEFSCVSPLLYSNGDRVETEPSRSYSSAREFLSAFQVYWLKERAVDEATRAEQPRASREEAGNDVYKQKGIAYIASQYKEDPSYDWMRFLASQSGWTRPKVDAFLIAVGVEQTRSFRKPPLDQGLLTEGRRLLDAEFRRRKVDANADAEKDVAGKGREILMGRFGKHFAAVEAEMTRDPGLKAVFDAVLVEVGKKNEFVEDRSGFMGRNKSTRPSENYKITLGVYDRVKIRAERDEALEGIVRLGKRRFAEVLEKAGISELNSLDAFVVLANDATGNPFSKEDFERAMFVFGGDGSSVERPLFVDEKTEPAVHRDQIMSVDKIKNLLQEKIHKKTEEDEIRNYEARVAKGEEELQKHLPEGYAVDDFRDAAVDPGEQGPYTKDAFKRALYLFGFGSYERPGSYTAENIASNPAYAALARADELAINAVKTLVDRVRVRDEGERKYSSKDLEFIRGLLKYRTPGIPPDYDAVMRYAAIHRGGGRISFRDVGNPDFLIWERVEAARQAFHDGEDKREKAKGLDMLALAELEHSYMLEAVRVIGPGRKRNLLVAAQRGKVAQADYRNFLVLVGKYRSLNISDAELGASKAAFERVKALLNT